MKIVNRENGALLKPVIRSGFFFLLLVSFLAVFSCTQIEKATEKAALSVGNRSLSKDELKTEIMKAAFELGIPRDEIKDYLDRLLQRIIDLYLMFEYGESQGIELTEAEFAAALKALESDYPADVFKEMLVQRFIDYQDWKEALRRQLLIQKIISSALEHTTPVTVEDIKRYFDNHRDEFRHDEKLKVRQIVTATKEEAEGVLELLHQGSEWDDLAANFSIAPEGKEGGVIGWISKGILYESIEELLFSLPVGKASSVLKTPYGFHIFEVMERVPSGEKSLLQARPEIESKLLQSQKDNLYQEWLRELRNRLPVKINHKMIKQLEFV